MRTGQGGFREWRAEETWPVPGTSVPKFLS